MHFLKKGDLGDEAESGKRRAGEFDGRRRAWEEESRERRLSRNQANHYRHGNRQDADENRSGAARGQGREADRRGMGRNVARSESYERCTTGNGRQFEGCGLPGFSLAVSLFGPGEQRGGQSVRNRADVKKPRQHVGRSLEKLLQLEILAKGPRVGVVCTYRFNPATAWKGTLQQGATEKRREVKRQEAKKKGAHLSVVK